MSSEAHASLASLKAQRLELVAKAEAAREADPVPDGFTRLSFGEIERNYAALAALSERRLMDGPPEKRVRLLIRRHYSEGYQMFKDLHHLIIKNNPVPENWEDDERIPIVIAERRQHLLEELRRDTFDIPTVPKHLLLTSDDMPVSSIKGELGHQNRTGIADIKIKLGALYVETNKKGEEEEDDSDG